MDEMKIVRKTLSKLRRKHSKRIRLVELFGGVVDYSKRTPYKYSRRCKLLRRSPEIFAFQVAKKLERQGLLKVEFIGGWIWLISQLHDYVPWREFWNAL